MSIELVRMNRMRKALFGLAALLAAGTAPPVDASTFNRVGLDYLVAENGTIVVGEVVDARSYWNEGRTFILTDYRVSVTEVLKGQGAAREITVTIPGGTVDDLTARLVGAADLVPGKWYVLFLDRANMMGARGLLSVRDHSQGVFDLEMTAQGLRAVSQARRHSLRPDARGNGVPVGGGEGMPFTTLIQTVRELADRERGSRQEVK
ncbi:MAG: hypothetical protein QOH06_4857 [Acidobacteriota bacterium]|jgi:hypothetical protein|nr:hypothetical protein [Acidobacteriota bacterium]